ncbi:hypothetical protein F5B21DRAFT_486102 [Xylaria acuta]|nr:hypothetical protein F5B21DRAFT_486102 [Xylaria acuta]
MPVLRTDVHRRHICTNRITYCNRHHPCQTSNIIITTTVTAITAITAIIPLVMPGLTSEKMPAASDDDDNAKSANTNTATATAKTKTKTKTEARARVHDMLAYTQRQVDRVVSPSTRQRAIDSTTAFASKRPLLSLFIAAQLLTALIPLLLFATFVLSTTALAFACAAAFALFWAGVALLMLVPTLFLTFGFAVLVWLWAVGTYVVFRAVYARLPARGKTTNTSTNGNDGGRRVIFSKTASDLDAVVDAEVREARE